LSVIINSPICGLDYSLKIEFYANLRNDIHTLFRVEQKKEGLKPSFSILIFQRVNRIPMRM
jgi:hypothetical protein